MSSTSPVPSFSPPKTPPPPPRDQVPLFSPRTPHPAARANSPVDSDDADDDLPILSLDNLPKGHQLVVRGCISDIAGDTPVSLVTELLDQLGADSRFAFFSKLDFLVTPFSNRTSTVSSACYIELRSDSSSAEPRIDLLEIVKDAIGEAKPGWEVRWSAGKKGSTDKRMSARLLNLYPGTVDPKSIPSEHLPLISAYIEKKGFKVAGIFASYGGPQISFLLPHDADRFVALKTIEVPAKVSKHRATIEPVREIKIEHPFEIVIQGAGQYDGAGQLITKWAERTVREPTMSARSPVANPDLVIFHVSTWAATLKVLQAVESFRRVDEHRPTLYTEPTHSTDINRCATTNTVPNATKALNRPTDNTTDRPTIRPNDQRTDQETK